MRKTLMCVTALVSMQSWSRMTPVAVVVLGGTVLTFTGGITAPDTSHERMHFTTSLTTDSPEDFMLSGSRVNAAVTTDRYASPSSILDLLETVGKVLPGTLDSNSPIIKRVQETNQ